MCRCLEKIGVKVPRLHAARTIYFPGHTHARAPRNYSRRPAKCKTNLGRSFSQGCQVNAAAVRNMTLAFHPTSEQDTAAAVGTAVRRRSVEGYYLVWPAGRIPRAASEYRASCRRPGRRPGKSLQCVPLTGQAGVRTRSRDFESHEEATSVMFRRFRRCF